MFTCLNSPVSGSNPNAVAVMLALPPVKSNADRPWKSCNCDCTAALQVTVVALKGTKEVMSFDITQCHELTVPKLSHRAARATGTQVRCSGEHEARASVGAQYFPRHLRPGLI